MNARASSATLKLELDGSGDRDRKHLDGARERIPLSGQKLRQCCLLDSDNLLLARSITQAIKRKAIMRRQIELDQVPVVLETLLMAVEQINLLRQKHTPQRPKIDLEFGPFRLAAHRQKHRARLRG